MCFFFNDTATTEIYTLSLHDALPIWDLFREMKPKDVVQDETLFRELKDRFGSPFGFGEYFRGGMGAEAIREDRKSTRLNSSHANISYAVFCLKKKNRAVSKLLPTSPP